MLDQGFVALEAEGRLAIISFHSLEDRMIKRFMRSQAQPPNRDAAKHLPIPDSELPAEFQPKAKIIKPLVSICHFNSGVTFCE